MKHSITFHTYTHQVMSYSEKHISQEASTASPSSTEAVFQEDSSDALRINPFLTTRTRNADASLNTAASATASKSVHKPQPKVQPPLQKVTKRTSNAREEECYSNSNEHRGVCLVLEHDTFSPNLQLR